MKRFAAGGGRGAILGQVVHNERVVEEMESSASARSTRSPPWTSRRSSSPRTAFRRPFTTAPESAGLQVLDTTCKFVYDIHRESKDALADGYHLVFIGDPKHREVIGYTNDLDPSDVPHRLDGRRAPRRSTGRSIEKIKIFYQTTLNAEEFEDVVQTIERARRTRRARRHDLLRDERESGRRARAREGSGSRRHRRHRRQEEREHEAPLGDLPRSEARRTSCRGSAISIAHGSRTRASSA